MKTQEFFPPHEGMRLEDLAAALGGRLVRDISSDKPIRAVAPVYRAMPDEVCYILSRKNRHELETCQAGAVICDESLLALMPETLQVIICANPHTAFAQAGALLYPHAMRPAKLFLSQTSDVHEKAHVDPTAHLEGRVIVEPMAVIGANAWIGDGSIIGAGAIIGAGVKIGRNCSIAAGSSILCAYIGDDVIIHNGARIGQDGFGYAPARAGMEKIVQIGRVIIQNNVEIGANTTIDRGTMDDTVIGEGTKIDNQVQIGHNVRVGRHCAIVAKVGIAGSTRIGDGVQIGGAVAINGHITIGDGAQIAALSGVVSSIPRGAKYGGTPARPLKDYLRDLAELMMKSESRRKRGQKDDD
jgi:UDP-3-O-[3-hydroxymyristoyl] glucosamine N-acyltransferase